MKVLEVRTPASSANLGPGFDALSIALGVYLKIRVEIRGPLPSPSLALAYEGASASGIDVNVEANLLSKTVSL